MNDEIDMAVDTLYDIAKMGSQDFSGTAIKSSALPQDIKTVLKQFISDKNLDPSDIDDDAYKGSWFDDEHYFYALTFEHSDPETYNGTVIIGPVAPNKVGVIGVSATRSS